MALTVEPEPGAIMLKLTASNCTENIAYTDNTAIGHIAWGFPGYPRDNYDWEQAIKEHWKQQEREKEQRRNEQRQIMAAMDQERLRQKQADKQKEGEPKVRYLFQVYVVNPKSGKVEFDAKIVAENREQAILKAGLPLNVLSSIEDFDILTQQIGQVRAKKEVQKVKVVTEDK